jgi:YVTN family beta-propeller protein
MSLPTNRFSRNIGVSFRIMKITLTSLLLLAALLGVSAPRRAETPADALLVLSKTDQTLAIVNPVTMQVIARVPVGNDPHEVIASADGRIAYVSNYGSGAYNTLAVVDLVGQKALPNIDLGALRGPHGLTFVGGKVWFTAEAAKAIGSYDPIGQNVDWIFGTGQNRTHMIWVSPEMNRIVTTNVSSATVSIIEKVIGAGPGRGGPPLGAPANPERGTPDGARGRGTQGNLPSLPGRGNVPGGQNGRGGPQGAPGGDWNQTVIPVGSGAEGFDVSPDEKEIWVANAGDGTISIINIATKSVTQTVAADTRGANRLKFTPDGRRVLVAGQAGANGSALTVIDAATRNIIKRIAVGRGAAGIVMQPDGARAFVACSPDNNVAVINLATLEVVGRIDAGGNPDGVAWATRR